MRRGVVTATAVAGITRTTAAIGSGVAAGVTRAVTATHTDTKTTDSIAEHRSETGVSGLYDVRTGVAV